VRRSRSVALDEIDHDLLELLQEDAGRTLRQLAETVRLSPSAVQRRIGRYQAAGLIARKVAVLDPRAVSGSLLAVVLVTLAQESSESHDALRTRLLAAPEVQQCYDVAGEWDYVVVLVANDMSHCRELVARLFLDDSSVDRCETLPVFDPVKLGLGIPTRLGRSGRKLGVGAAVRPRPDLARRRA
jgi:Lrp/AsnC family transcriptional regulator, leucine-responsive regulatory protein